MIQEITVHFPVRAHPWVPGPIPSERPAAGSQSVNSLERALKTSRAAKCVALCTRTHVCAIMVVKVDGDHLVLGTTVQWPFDFQRHHKPWQNSLGPSGPVSCWHASATFVHTHDIQALAWFFTFPDHSHLISVHLVFCMDHSLLWESEVRSVSPRSLLSWCTDILYPEDCAACSYGRCCLFRVIVTAHLDAC